MRSHPTWVRGLKLTLAAIYGTQRTVAPYVGAWIETEGVVMSRMNGLSHPTWVRGLKPVGNIS